MNFHSIYLFLAFFSIVSVLHADEARPFNLYQPIIDKCLFGPPPADPSVIPDKNSSSSSAASKTERELTQEQQQLEKAVSVSALNQKPDGVIMVGFSDSSDKKTPDHYYLAVGESKNGWIVVNADIATKKVVLEKDGVEIERTLGDRSAAPAKSNSVASNASSSRSPLLSRRPGGMLLGNRGLMSRRAVRRQEEENVRQMDIRREEDRKKAEAEAALRREQESAERAEQRQSLLALQEEMRKMREARERTNEANNQDGNL